MQILCYWTSQLYWTVDKVWRRNILRVLVTWTLLITQELCKNKLLKNTRLFQVCITEHFTTKAQLSNSLKILIDRCRNTGFIWCFRARRVQAITHGPLTAHYWVIDESMWYSNSKCHRKKRSSSGGIYIFFFPWETYTKTPIVAFSFHWAPPHSLEDWNKKPKYKGKYFYSPGHLKKSHFSLESKAAHCKSQYNLLLNGACDKAMCLLEIVH